MRPTNITTVEKLESYLYRALQLEHATIPPYLTALYTIVPGSNSDAVHVLRVVVVEEMLHLTLAANLLNAVGGKPDLTKSDFVPTYPTPLPDGETDFEVSLTHFSKEAICTFLKIERPAAAPAEEQRIMARKSGGPAGLASVPGDEERRYYSIGEFYEEIERGFEYLAAQPGINLFKGDPKRQVTSEYYYSGGGQIVPVTDLCSAKTAIQLIQRQGEGLGGGIYDAERELAHYYRFDQLQRGRYYQAGDQPHQPTGPELTVDWKAVYPAKTNARLSDYDCAPELKSAAAAFNGAYTEFLSMLTAAYDGKPQLLLEAVPRMFRLRDGIQQLVRNPLPGQPGVNAAPTFEVGGR